MTPSSCRPPSPPSLLWLCSSAISLPVKLSFGSKPAGLNTLLYSPSFRCSRLLNFIASVALEVMAVVWPSSRPVLTTLESLRAEATLRPLVLVLTVYDICFFEDSFSFVVLCVLTCPAVLGSMLTTPWLCIWPSSGLWVMS